MPSTARAVVRRVQMLSKQTLPNVIKKNETSLLYLLDTDMILLLGDRPAAMPTAANHSSWAAIPSISSSGGRRAPLGPAPISKCVPRS